MLFRRWLTVALIILAGFFVYFPIGASAGSLDQYLQNDMGLSADFAADASSQEIMQNRGDAPISGKKDRHTGLPMGKIHKYLGYSTLAAAAAAGVSGSDNGFHKGAGAAAAVLGVAACATGFAEYGYFFDPAAGLSKHNIHIVLSTLATAGFVATAVDAYANDDDGHAGLGIGSGVLMVIPVAVLHF